MSCLYINGMPLGDLISLMNEISFRDLVYFDKKCSCETLIDTCFLLWSWRNILIVFTCFLNPWRSVDTCLPWFQVCLITCSYNVPKKHISMNLVCFDLQYHAMFEHLIDMCIDKLVTWESCLLLPSCYEKFFIDLICVEKIYA